MLDRQLGIAYKGMAMKLKIIGWALITVFWAAILSAPPVSQKNVKQVVIKEVTRVEGKIHKPEVWYLLPRSELNFEGLKLESKLTPKIEEPIEKAPF